MNYILLFLKLFHTNILHRHSSQFESCLLFKRSVYNPGEILLQGGYTCSDRSWWGLSVTWTTFPCQPATERLLDNGNKVPVCTVPSVQHSQPSLAYWPRPTQTQYGRATTCSYAAPQRPTYGQHGHTLLTQTNTLKTHGLIRYLSDLRSVCDFFLCLSDRLKYGIAEQKS